MALLLVLNKVLYFVSRIFFAYHPANLRREGIGCRILSEPDEAGPEFQRNGFEVSFT